MSKVLAVNGSPRMEKGTTEMILAPFLKGMSEAGAEVETVYTSLMRIKPCDCGDTGCWYKHPSECRHKDDMRALFPRLKEADILVLATPVYVPLPGDMQGFLNRLCPLLDPVLEFRERRTRAHLRKDVRIKKMALVSTGGWWEKENFDTVTRIVEDLAATMSVEYAGAVLRPHVSMVQRDGGLTEEGGEVLRAVERAGHELIADGAMKQETLDSISRPLVSEETYRRRLNRLVSNER